MVLSEFLTETRRRWLKAFKLFKRGKSRKISLRNRVSPALVRSPSYSGTVDARSEIDLQTFCACRASLPPLHIISESSYENQSYYSGYNSVDSEQDSSPRSSECSSRAGRSCSDSAYDSARSSPARAPLRPPRPPSATYYNVHDSEDSSSVRTEYTLLEYDPEERPGDDENAQNMINESIELVSSL